MTKSSLLLVFIFIVFFVGLFIFGLFQFSIPGRWCNDAQSWQGCYRDWLGSMAGYVALVVGAFTVLAIKDQIAASEKNADTALYYKNTECISKYRKSLEIAIPTANTLKENRKSFEELFEKIPELLEAEFNPLFANFKDSISKFNTEIGNHISNDIRNYFPINEKNSFKLKKLYFLKKKIQTELDKLMRT